MSKLTIVKFGGSAIGIDGEGIPQIIKRIKEIQKNGKLVVVCSAPLTTVDGRKKSLTDVVLGIGNNVVNGNSFDFSIVEKSYSKILEYLSDESKNLGKETIDEFLKNSKDAIDQNVFGAPSYDFKNQIFWGQDRLEYLEDAIKNITI